jgi:ParB family transcriptional regulator, chromosome partitioning protein
MMAKNIPKMPLPKLDDLFTTEEERTNDKLEKVIDIKISDIDDFPDHPFKVIDDDEMEKMKNSIIDNKVIIPALVRPKQDGRYEMISGHRRKRASELANKETLPCVVRELTDDEAVIIMVDSNIQREEILPSEKAYAYKMKLEALSNKGKRNDLTSSQVATRLDTATLIGKEKGDSRDTVFRYIKLTELIPELLEMVDKKEIALLPAFELAFLKDEEQYAVLDCIECNVATPSHAQARILKRLSQEGTLTQDKIDDILSQEKPNQIPKIKFNESRIRNVLPKSITDDKIEDFVVNAIGFYKKHLQKQKSMER